MAEDNNEPKEEKQQGETPEGGAKKKKFNFSLSGILTMLPMIVMVVNLIGMGAAGYYAYLGTLGLNPKVIKEQQARKMIYNEEIFKDKPVVYSLDPFTVNLSDKAEDRVVQVKVTLEMLDENGFEEVVSMGAHARDTIVHILNGKQFNELQSIQGKLFLKDEITVALNKQLNKSFIKDVYFSRFVLQ